MAGRRAAIGRPVRESKGILHSMKSGAAVAAVLTLAVLAVAYFLVSRPTPPVPMSPMAALPSHPPVPTRFVDTADEAGLRYRWSLPGKSPRNILQMIGNGCAFLDYNNDGNLDILLVGPKLALYKGDGHGHFTDVTLQVGLDKINGYFLG